MSETPIPKPGDIPPMPAKVQARVFRAKGMIVYPGKILVLGADSWGFRAIEDADLDPDSERIMGVSLWGPIASYCDGVVALEPASEGQFCIPIAGDSEREPVGVPLLDSWIARADALRKLMIGEATTFGPPPLSDDQLQAAAVEIYKAIRERAIALLKVMPASDRDTSLALARIADAPHPTLDMLTNAIEQLLASLRIWPIQQTRSLSHALQENEQTFPTAKVLRDAAGISSGIFLRIRKDAGIDHGLR